MQGYREDLAYIHDVGHSDYALGAAPGLIGLLRRHGVRNGLVVDLGCGGGRWARELNRAGYRVLGIDQSPSMIRLARRRAPQSRFRIASLHDVALPPWRRASRWRLAASQRRTAMSTSPHECATNAFKRLAVRWIQW